MRIVLDPGHGGSTEVGGSSPNNAVGPTGLLEKSVTLDIALLAQLHLTSLGVECTLTRQRDVNMGLEDRARVANDLRADGFVSIHMNASEQHDAQGTETWRHEQATTPSKSLAATVQAAVVGATNLRDRGVKIGRLAVTRPDFHHAATGACLVEVSFMDRADEEARLKQSTYKDRIARALAQGIYGWMVALGRAEVPGFKSLLLDSDAPVRSPEDGFEMLNGVDVSNDAEPPPDAEECRAPETS